MSNIFWNNGLYKRGFIVVPDSIDIPVSVADRWKILDLPQGYKIAYDPLNKCSFYLKSDVWVCLCGSHCMDVDSGHMDFNLIAEKLAFCLRESEEAFYDYLEGLNGRFVSIYSVYGKVYFLNDACACRSVFFSTKHPIFASHYNLIQEIVNEEQDPFLDKFREWREDAVKDHHIKPWILPANKSPWNNIVALVANHKVCLDDMLLRRYYPRKNMSEMDVEKACDIIADILRREGNILADNYKIYESLTAGNDSRITLAAMKERKSKITCFTYRDPVLKEGNYESEDRLQNFKFAKNLCDKEDIDHREIMTSSAPLPKELAYILNRNHYHSHIPSVLAPYSEMFDEGSIHLRSNLIEIIRVNDHMPYSHVDENTVGGNIARLNFFYDTHRYFDDVSEIFKQYYFDSQLNELYDYPAYHFAFWEYRLGMWNSAAVLTETDLVCDTFQLFNNRRLLNIGLCMPSFYRNRSVIYGQLLKRLWPELLNYGLPNCSISQYDLLNKNYSNKDSFLYFNGKLTKSSANIYNAERKVKAIFEPYMQGIVMGFAVNKIKKGDYVSIKYKQTVKKDLNYYFQCCFKTSYFDSVKSGVYYSILFNGKEIYKLSTTVMYATNVVRCMYKAKDDGENEIEIRLIAEKDFADSLHNGVLDISNIESNREYFGIQRRYEPEVVDIYNQVAIKRRK